MSPSTKVNLILIGVLVALIGAATFLLNTDKKEIAYVRNYTDAVSWGKSDRYSQIYAQAMVDGKGKRYADAYYDAVSSYGGHSETYASVYAQAIVEGKSRLYSQIYARAIDEGKDEYSAKDLAEKARRKFEEKTKAELESLKIERSVKRLPEENLSDFNKASSWAYRWAIDQGESARYAKTLGAYYANYRVLEGESQSAALSKATQMANYVHRPR